MNSRYSFSTLLLIIVLTAEASAQKIVKVKNAHKYIGKEVIIEGTFCTFANSSYMQTAWFYLGPDTAHKQLTVVVQGDVYYKQGKIWVGNYMGKVVKIRGIIKADEKKQAYLVATDSIILVPN